MNKSDFPIFKNHPKLVYLDNAATSQKPQVVIDAITDFYTNANSNVHRGIHKLAERATILYENSRKTVAGFLGVESDNIVFTSGTTEGINLIVGMIANSPFARKKSQSILLSEMEHHSNIVPWQQLAKKLGWTVEFIKITDEFRLDEDDLKNKLKKDTSVLALTHMSNVLGTINNIEELCSYAKSINPEILTVIDGAQYIPHHKVDLGKLKTVDFYCFSGHKMLGPTGIGVLYGRKELLEQLDPAKFGGGMIAKVERKKSTWAELPEKFEAGTPHIAGAIGLAAAVRYLEKIDRKKLDDHMGELSAYTVESLRSLPEVTLFQPDQKEVNTIFSFTVKSMHPHDVAQLLDQDDVAIRAGHHCCQILHRETLKIPASCRASIYFYNDKHDIDKLADSLKNIVNRFN